MSDDIVTALRQMNRGDFREEPRSYMSAEDAADEIQRLRKIIRDFYFEEEKYQDAINSDFVEHYIIPQSWKDAYTAFQKEAQKIEFGEGQ